MFWHFFHVFIITFILKKLNIFLKIYNDDIIDTTDDIINDIIKFMNHSNKHTEIECLNDVRKNKIKAKYSLLKLEKDRDNRMWHK